MPKNTMLHKSIKSTKGSNIDDIPLLERHSRESSISQNRIKGKQNLTIFMTKKY